MNNFSRRLIFPLTLGLSILLAASIQVSTVSPTLAQGQRTTVDPILVNERAEAEAHLTISRCAMSRVKKGRATLKKRGSG